MKKISIALLVCSTLLLAACSNDKTTDSTSKQQETKSSQTEETSSTTTTSSILSSATDSPSTTVTTSTTNSVTTPMTAQEETYEQLKQRALQSTQADRSYWSNKEWEAFGVALNENGLAMDDAGNIITQAQRDQLDSNNQAQQQNDDTTQDISIDTNTLTGFVNVYGMSPAAYKVQNGMSVEEALRSTPRHMKTSGEIQTGYTQYGIE
ncbi:hypothetical protein P7H59_01590 [Enterococcus viikkiensis]|uniref:Lipoprotein n=1 Tax=Enterococcus viikkiensis TaxID=930854 RepID=A0ABU3FMF4_9ENTE|nr:hypothetical protein [Enterococcus viikkiensis]MDT2827140.1 hypothetical protein [Enterococcus viikkiensis]